MDLFVVASIGFDQLYAFVIVRLAAETSSGSTSQQIRRQNGLHVKERRHFLGMRLRTTSSAIGIGSMAVLSRANCVPWASETSLPHQPRPGRLAFVERLVGSIRRECVDHIIVLGEAHPRQILQSYARYYNEIRTHADAETIACSTHLHWYAATDGMHVLKSLARVELLILDDWGLAPLTSQQGRDLLEIVDDRHGCHSTIVTSQLPSDNRRCCPRPPRAHRASSCPRWRHPAQTTGKIRQVTMSTLSAPGMVCAA
jgi:hypothetical protein